MLIDIDALGNNCTANPETNEVYTEVVEGLELPLAMPGSHEPVKIPSQVVTFGLTKKAALQYAEMLKKEAESLPDEKTSSIIQANDLRAVEQLAKVQQDLTKTR